MGFMFAPAHHSAMKHVGPVRAELGIRTIFNLLGPMSNPAAAKYQLMGVFDDKWLTPLAETLKGIGSQKAWVVHGSDGLDEITTTGPTSVAALEDGTVRRFDVSPEDASRGLSRMSVDISKAIFRKLATDGEIFSSEKFRTVKATYFREALDRIDSYYNDALMNGLTLDRHAEEAAVELFAKNIMLAGETYLTNPMETPFLPSWNRVNAAAPDFLARYAEAVRLDNEA